MFRLFGSKRNGIESEEALYLFLSEREQPSGMLLYFMGRVGLVRQQTLELSLPENFARWSHR